VQDVARADFQRDRKPMRSAARGLGHAPAARLRAARCRSSRARPRAFGAKARSPGRPARPAGGRGARRGTQAVECADRRFDPCRNGKPAASWAATWELAHLADHPAETDDRLFGLGQQPAQRAASPQASVPCAAWARAHATMSISGRAPRSRRSWRDFEGRGNADVERFSARCPPASWAGAPPWSRR
jgi:hypothetical protein